ncbi:MAG: abhydrolase domain-containing protein 14 [Planctomycetota bacterium]|jgi:abhydrolase domain-containing protein 14
MHQRLVAPSMSGSYLGPLLAESPECLLGLVPIAPAAAASFALPSTGGQADSPPPSILILWGENDTVFPVAGAATLSAALGNAPVEIFPGGSHPCYLDDPELFHGLLTAFVEEVLER